MQGISLVEWDALVDSQAEYIWLVSGFCFWHELIQLTAASQLFRVWISQRGIQYACDFVSKNHVCAAKLRSTQCLIDFEWGKWLLAILHLRHNVILCILSVKHVYIIAFCRLATFLGVPIQKSPYNQSPHVCIIYHAHRSAFTLMGFSHIKWVIWWGHLTCGGCDCTVTFASEFVIKAS